jgi:polysaccharide pyruvyl transferase CsaB
VRVVVAGWAGSTNLGDELVLAGLLVELRRAGLTPTVLSVDPAGTRETHGVDAVSGSDPRAVLAAVAQADAVVLGGGGLLQDETGPFNLPYHLSRVWAARGRRTPVVGLGLGAGRLHTAVGRALVRRSLAGVPLTVRDAPSAALLERLGLARPAVAADLAFSLPDTDVAPRDRLVVCLRPWRGPGRLLPASLRTRTAPLAPEPLLTATARALDDAATATGLAPHFVALQADRDGPLHEAVAARMRMPATTATPGLDTVRDEIGSGRAVVATRYHGAVCAALARRPAVLIGYSPKVDALAADLGDGARLLAWRADGPTGLADALTDVLDRTVDDGVATLRARAARHAAVLARLS